MEIPITATDANRRFSELLRGVQAGKRYVITSHGRSVARLAKFEPGDGEADAREQAKRALLRHLRTRRPLKIKPWSREELYERGE